MSGHVAVEGYGARRCIVARGLDGLGGIAAGGEFLLDMYGLRSSRSDCHYISPNEPLRRSFMADEALCASLAMLAQQISAARTFWVRAYHANPLRCALRSTTADLRSHERMA